MKAVNEFFDRNHNALIRFGGLIAIIFLVIIVPAVQYSSMKKEIEAEKEINAQLLHEIDDLNDAMSVYKTAYAKQQVIQKEVQCLAKNIYFEAASEPHSGKIAVAEVTMNRVKNGFADTVCGVVTQKNNGVCQFSWVCQPKKAITMYPQWKESREIAENILISQKKYSTIQGAMFFHADYVEPAWAATKEVVRKIGRHVFYKG